MRRRPLIGQTSSTTPIPARVTCKWPFPKRGQAAYTIFNLFTASQLFKTAATQGRTCLRGLPIRRCVWWIKIAPAARCIFNNTNRRRATCQSWTKVNTVRRRVERFRKRRRVPTTRLLCLRLRRASTCQLLQVLKMKYSTATRAALTTPSWSARSRTLSLAWRVPSALHHRLDSRIST